MKKALMMPIAIACLLCPPLFVAVLCWLGDEA